MTLYFYLNFISPGKLVIHNLLNFLVLISESHVLTDSWSSSVPQKDEYIPSLRAASEILGAFLLGNGW